MPQKIVAPYEILRAWNIGQRNIFQDSSGHGADLRAGNHIVREGQLRHMIAVARGDRPAIQAIGRSRLVDGKTVWKFGGVHLLD